MINLVNSYSMSGLKSLVVLTVAVFGVVLVGCVEEPPSRDEIPHIKVRLSELEQFYRSAYANSPDSLLTQRFSAEMGKRGQWEALVVDGQPWPFDGFANLSFYYTQEIAEVELSFRYKSLTTETDSLIPVKIRLNYMGEKWYVEKITPIEPLVY